VIIIITLLLIQITKKTGNTITASGYLNAYLDGSLLSSAHFISLNV